jgi:oligogalacturonide lyase
MAYFNWGKRICSLNLETYEIKDLWTIPEKFFFSMISFTHGGDFVYLGVFQDFSDRFPVDLQHDYIGFEETFLAKPESRILKIAADGSGVQCIRTEQGWIGHVNVSPTQNHLLTFCHEGPWNLVDHRIWGMNADTGEVWKIRPEAPGERIGHEYWYQDGLRVGYHGANASGGKLFGVVGYDNTGGTEVSFEHLTGHIHSHDERLIVGDGSRDSKYIRLWKWDGEGYQGPKALCQHYSSFKTQADHPHPCFSPDGKYVLFTSDRSGYACPYLAKLEAFESLPDIGADNLPMGHKSSIT